ncbi:hypothetical protein KO494_13720 [Lacinutrix sp. C3R15]|uniref:hypothetical protein n=1 Tax=Flavobacteriaceae TaxID=49546 RepID=UPI001C092C66|nr:MULTISPECIES: hypothetical protein [Flavobacteriaceae]MBU2940600.1 hypothetical protein [Lacinutrix sp. C3R15]MDO6623918.1 hypothetical protein [Oceanihabitans sp. 1_MG-2023]
MKKLIITLSAVFFITTTITASNGNHKIKEKDLQEKLHSYKNSYKKDMYLWEVESNYGKASGYAASLEKAKEMIVLVGTKDVTTFKIIVSN